VRRVALASLTAGLQFALGHDSFSGPFRVDDMAVLPGNANAIAISRRNIGFSPRHEGVAIYDNGVARPTTTPDHTGSNAIEVSGTANVLYGLNQETTEFGFRRMTVDASGVVVTKVTQNLISVFGVDIEHDAGRIYTTNGRVIDPEAATLLGTMAASGSIEPVSSRGLTFFLNGTQLQAFDQATFLLVRSLTATGILGSSPGLIHWGNNGLAFRTTDGKLVLVNWDPRNPRINPAHVVNLSPGQTVSSRDFGNSDTSGNPPVITSNGGGAAASISAPENSTAVTDVDATDADAGSTLLYSISGGADATKFSINATSGLLSFVSAPDFETPTDIGGDNVYDVVVQVSDGSLADTQALAVSVTNVAESCSTVVVNTSDAGAGSLREAMNCANSKPGLDTISFNIPGSGVKKISPLSALPTITDPVIIDGYTQPGAVQNSSATGFNGSLQVELYGSGVGSNVNGLTIVGGSSTVKGLVINGFSLNGIVLQSGSGNRLEGNFIGTDASGLGALGNGTNGIIIAGGSSNNVIGGGSPAARNVISGNLFDDGIEITTSGNTIAGNLIGVNASGTAALANQYGVTLFSGTSNVIGSNGDGVNDAAESNVISGNRVSGVAILSAAQQATPSQNIVAGNYIGTNAAGAAIGNAVYGVMTSVTNNTIGPNNTIAFNGSPALGGAGVILLNGTSLNTAVVANSIFSNIGLGIDLRGDGVTPNDQGDGDSGDNNLQNFPQITAATLSGANLTVQYAVPSATANSAFPLRVEFFKADADGQEGKAFLGFDTYAASQAGLTKVFTFAAAAQITAGDKIVATATDSNGNTSEFSVNTAVQSTGCNLIVVNTLDSGPGSLREAINCANSTPNIDYSGDSVVDPDVITFNIPGTGVKTIGVTTNLPAITEAVVLDGYTQPGASTNTNAIDDADPNKRGFNGTLLIELTDNGSAIDGLSIASVAAGSVVRGLVINHFSHNGINLGSGSVVEGCFIGTDATGTLDRGNHGSGIVASGANSRIGGTSPASRNIVSNNWYWGIELANFGLSALGNNVVQGNFVGTDASGTKALGNRQIGVLLYQVGRDTVGGTQSGARNIISGNSVGINVQVSTGNTIQGNYIGVDVTGAKALANSGAGIVLDIGGATMIGGTTAAARNVISGNGAGIFVGGSENIIQGNFIGVDASGTQPLGNTADGIHISRGEFDNLVGGTVPGAANVIAFNGGNAVSLQETYRHSILANSIFSNGGLGIDIEPSGPNPNDPGDEDNGANYQQNFPEISSVVRSGATLTLHYVVPSLPTNSVYPLRVEFFKADSDGQEGQTFIGFDTYTAPEAGTTKTISFLPAIPIGVGNKLVATATDNRGDTSEFSGNVTVSGPNVRPMLAEIDGDNAIVVDESTVILASALHSDFNLSATDVDSNQDLRFSLAVDSAAPPGCTAYDFSDPAHTGLLQITIPSQSVTPGQPNGPSSATGTLRTKAGPNAAGNWCFVVLVTDGVVTDERELMLTVNRTNSVPQLSSNGAGDAASISIKENITAVTDVDATDLDTEQTLIFSIAGGPDADKFAIDAASGVLTFVSGPNFESPTDTGGNNVYDVIVQVRDGGLSDTQTLAVTVTNVNDEPPVITSNGGGAIASISVPENITGVTDVNATDPDSASLVYSLAGGADAASFSIHPTTGVLTFRGGRNFESPNDVGRDNVYDVIVRVSDGTFSDMQTIAVTVTNVVELPNITSNGGGSTASISVPENTIIATDVNASDEIGTTLTYSISGGADALKFSINGATGLLSFVAASNFESPGDAGGNNVYDVIVQVTNGQVTDSQAIAVTVTNANDLPVAVADEYSTSEDASLAIVPSSGVLTNDTDEDVGDSKMVISVAGGGVLWDEASSGDLPQSEPYPVFMLAPGVNEIRGTTGDRVNAPSDLDAFIIQVPAGLQLTSMMYSVVRATGGIRQINWSVPPLGGFGTIVPLANFFPFSSQFPLGAGQYTIRELQFFKDVGENPSDIANYSFRFNVTGEPVVGRQLTLPSGALVTMQPDGSLLYDPNGKFEPLSVGQTATDSFTYTVADSQGGMSTSTVTITVVGENDAPVASDDSFEALANTPRIITKTEYLANDSDVDSSVLTAAVAGQPGHGSVNLRLDGSFEYTPAAGYSGPDSFTYQLSDGQATSNSATVSITVTDVNDAPVVVLGGNMTGVEGSFFTAAGSILDDDIFDSLTASVDYGDGSGPQSLALKPVKTFELGHAYADNGTYVVTVSVRDASGLVGSASFHVIVHNVAPQILDWDGSARAVRGQTAFFGGTFSDPGTADTHTASVDWGDGQTSIVAATRAGGVWQVDAFHAYAAGGIYQAVLRVTDDDGGFAFQATTVFIVGTRLNGGVLEIVGTSQRDHVRLQIANKKVVVRGTLGNGRLLEAFPYSGIQRIVAYLGDGNDSLTVDSKVKLPLLASGGAGNDILMAGGGAAVLIGGSGQDQLSGAGRSDLLIAGTTAYDNNHAALSAILAEWSSTRSFTARLENLRTGSGPVLPELNVALKPSLTVFDDTSVDRLLGGGDLDWFLLDISKDKVKDKADRTN
jgi:VCBS repeat-containing protein